MKRLTFDSVRAALPDLEELRPILDELLSRSQPDDARAWAGSGELDTVGSRLVTPGKVDLSAVARREAERIGGRYSLIERALAAMAADRPHEAAEAFLEAAAAEEALDRPDRASAYADAAYLAVASERDRKIAALALRRSARARRALGDLSEALGRYDRSHAMALDMRDYRGAAEAAVGAGNVLEEQGHWDEADAWYRRALQALEPVEEPTPERWHALINLHIVARSRGALGESATLLDRAEAAAAAVDAAGANPFIDNARGQLLMAQGEFEDAARHFRKAIEAASDSRGRIQIRLNLAESFLARRRTLDAVEHAREAEREAIRARVTGKLPEVYRLLGRIASEQGNPDAFVFFERALDIARGGRRAVLEEALTLQAYAEAEARRGEEEAAGQLLEDARRVYGTLGITRERQRWADVFGPASDNQSPAQGKAS